MLLSKLFSAGQKGGSYSKYIKARACVGGKKAGSRAFRGKERVDWDRSWGKNAPEQRNPEGETLRLAEFQVQAPSMSRSNALHRWSILYDTEWEMGNDSELPAGLFGASWTLDSTFCFVFPEGRDTHRFFFFILMHTCFSTACLFTKLQIKPRSRARASQNHILGRRHKPVGWCCIGKHVGRSEVVDSERA